MSEFFAMGGYAAYVWPAYGITMVVLGLNVLLARREFRQTKQNLQRRTRREERNI